jgi:hypothetical protein
MMMKLSRLVFPLTIATFHLAYGEGDYGYNYSCLPTTSRVGTFYLSGEALFFRTDGEGLGFAQLIEETGGAADRVISVKDIDLDFKWDWGYRFAVGYTCPINGWDLKGTWTHFCTDATACTYQDEPPISAIVSTAWNSNIYDLNHISCLEELDGASFYVEKQAANGLWQWRLDDISALLGKSFYPSPCFAMRPFIGLRGLYSSQEYRSHLNQIVTLAIPAEGDLSFEASPLGRSKCDFFAIGLQGGLEMRWFFASYCDLFGTCSISTVRGKVKTSFEEKQGGEFVILLDQNNINLNTLILSTNIHNEFYDYKAIGDLALGLRVGTPIGAGRTKISGFVAYEQHLYYHFNNFRPAAVPCKNPLTSTIPGGDLSLWGVSAGISVDF